MEDWQKDLMEWLDTVTVAVEDFFEEVSQTVENMAIELERDFIGEIEQFLEDVFEPIIDFSDPDNRTVSSDFIVDADGMLSPKVNPSSNVHPACIGCRHYHGRVYQNTLLVCGMHPYGWEDLHCPDWEKDQLSQ
ncbi:conserved hypothetical protein [Rippkaea orientalis PCC 8801]|uniref:Uncharacterized protein n=1 Tax=Rippkaea orientalis (strain PCC 8801 / RF-1) TaxID=41431 RepID=B7K353_RIPO1|nr:hypothetical protein [Rippkaea orientalis]ACK64373.1 conserved hypothetical protein [Rippkaea orientalis PCC 8801]